MISRLLKRAHRRLFHDHPASVGETYWQHFAKACGFGLRLVFAGVACLLHAIVPGLFTRRASTTVSRINDEMRARISAIDDARAAQEPGRPPQSKDRPVLRAVD